MFFFELIPWYLQFDKTPFHNPIDHVYTSKVDFPGETSYVRVTMMPS
jgi:hypothetical protein